MNFVQKIILCSTIFIHEFAVCSNEEDRNQPILNQDIKTGLLISAIPASAWIYTRAAHNLKYLAAETFFYGDPILKLLQPDDVKERPCDPNDPAASLIRARRIYVLKDNYKTTERFKKQQTWQVIYANVVGCCWHIRSQRSL